MPKLVLLGRHPPKVSDPYDWSQLFAGSKDASTLPPFAQHGLNHEYVHGELFPGKSDSNLVPAAPLLVAEVARWIERVAEKLLLPGSGGKEGPRGATSMLSVDGKDATATKLNATVLTSPIARAFESGRLLQEALSELPIFGGKIQAVDPQPTETVFDSDADMTRSTAATTDVAEAEASSVGAHIKLLLGNEKVLMSAGTECQSSRGFSWLQECLRDRTVVSTSGQKRFPGIYDADSGLRPTQAVIEQEDIKTVLEPLLQEAVLMLHEEFGSSCPLKPELGDYTVENLTLVAKAAQLFYNCRCNQKAQNQLMSNGQNLNLQQSQGIPSDDPWIEKLMRVADQWFLAHHNNDDALLRSALPLLTHLWLQIHNSHEKVEDRPSLQQFHQFGLSAEAIDTDVVIYQTHDPMVNFVRRALEGALRLGGGIHGTGGKLDWGVGGTSKEPLDVRNPHPVVYSTYLVLHVDAKTGRVRVFVRVPALEEFSGGSGGAKGYGEGCCTFGENSTAEDSGEKLLGLQHLVTADLEMLVEGLRKFILEKVAMGSAMANLSASAGAERYVAELQIIERTLKDRANLDL